ncbi:hypothetical protein ASE75_06295 [Sphingomonas sp. Leaf17]|nr:hypothetical protein ASE75_06295 [Sphingomonas sp. Leaf17]
MTAALILALGACSSPDTTNDTVPAEAVLAGDPAPETPPAERVACARGDVPLTDDCTIERGTGGIITIRHPDGAFRRLEADGTAADGAETAIVTAVDGARDVTVGGDRYRLPQGSAEASR